MNGYLAIVTVDADKTHLFDGEEVQASTEELCEERIGDLHLLRSDGTRATPAMEPLDR